MQLVHQVIELHQVHAAQEQVDSATPGLELGFVDGVEHSAAIRALSNCEVFSLNRPDFEALLHKDPDLVYKVMRAVIRTAHARLRRMNVQYVELTNYIAKQHGRY